MGDITIGRLCACMGPQATDPYCPCEMQRMKIDGAYNCYGDIEAMARREAEFQDRLRAAVQSLRNRRAGE